jgi:hypothetical protein
LTLERAFSVQKWMIESWHRSIQFVFFNSHFPGFPGCAGFSHPLQSAAKVYVPDKGSREQDKWYGDH